MSLAESDEMMKKMVRNDPEHSMKLYRKQVACLLERSLYGDLKNLEFVCQPKSNRVFFGRINYTLRNAI